MHIKHQKHSAAGSRSWQGGWLLWHFPSYSGLPGNRVWEKALFLGCQSSQEGLNRHQVWSFISPCPLEFKTDSKACTSVHAVQELSRSRAKHSCPRSHEAKDFFTLPWDTTHPLAIGGGCTCRKAHLTGSYPGPTRHLRSAVASMEDCHFLPT